MNIGDRVRLIRDREEGIVTKIIDERLVEVTIEEGFAIPVLKSELALVNKAETDYFGDKKIEESPKHVSLEEQKKIKNRFQSGGHCADKYISRPQGDIEKFCHPPRVGSFCLWHCKKRQLGKGERDFWCYDQGKRYPVERFEG